MSKLRELAIELLDDDNGISSDAWAVLYEMLEQNDEKVVDIANAVKGGEGRIFLPEDHEIKP